MIKYLPKNNFVKEQKLTQKTRLNSGSIVVGVIISHI